VQKVITFYHPMYFACFIHSLLIVGLVKILAKRLKSLAPIRVQIKSNQTYFSEVGNKNTQYKSTHLRMTFRY